MTDFATLLDALGRQGSERTAVCHMNGTGVFTATLTTVADAPAVAEKHRTGDVWYSPQPLHERVTAGRGTARDVVGLREIYVDLDIKIGGIPPGAVKPITDDLSAMLGSDPVAVVMSGHG